MSTHPIRPTRAGIALVVALGLGSLGACSAAPTSTSAGAPAGSAVQGVSGPEVDAAASSDTIALISAADTQTDTKASTQANTQADSKTDRKADHKGLRSRLLRAVHATWVTDGKAGPVTHQAIRGEVTAVSATSVTVKAKDGVSMTFTVGSDTKVRARVATKGAKATDSSVSAVKVGQKALVVGVGATSPTARRIAFLTR